MIIKIEDMFLTNCFKNTIINDIFFQNIMNRYLELNNFTIFNIEHDLLSLIIYLFNPIDELLGDSIYIF